ncbi:hypothetical protein INT08_04255 [Prosthecochloris sp. N3]|uniref:Multidrug resistance protein MdtA-like C-terminal permuted SH3 domain-containing protein n=1 Tax=Prosthecochloris ethylica TaxID=2743976 RepID=A0ABR9XQT6_9CHLB|nr:MULTISPECIES: hypothetical protein [Prosthecochloris]MBF0586392.1 hypothetical protein [Prosthecochloris ethylica]MBF0636390.1 hypothetical protein [Prosthecochloris ethylica]NUK47564.1 hypothetical protein [Prosthecochloris ethylica]
MTYRVFVMAVSFCLVLGACHGGGESLPSAAHDVVRAETDGVAEALQVVRPGGEDVIAVPSSAVFMRGQLEGLQVLGPDGAMSVRWVRTGSEMDGTVAVLSGLDAGEIVVVPYDPSLEEGDLVTPKQ